MFAAIEHYEDAGRGAAIARNQNDEGRYQHYRGWWAKARAYETDADRALADEAYDRGWKEKRHVPKFTPFR